MTQPAAADIHPATRKARERAQGRARAQRWRDRHHAEIEMLRVRADAARIEEVLVSAFVERHVALREETGKREPALPLVDVIRTATTRLAGDGMDASQARDAVRSRLRAHAELLPNIPGRCAEESLGNHA